MTAAQNGRVIYQVKPQWEQWKVVPHGSEGRLEKAAAHNFPKTKKLALMNRHSAEGRTIKRETFNEGNALRQKEGGNNNMKHTKRMTSAVVGILMGLAPLPMLSQTTYPDNNQAVQNTVNSAQKAAEPTASVNASDKGFARNAAQIGMAEIELADLAQKRSSSDAVKDFAKKMVAEHAKANERLRAIVSRHNIGWPADLNAATKWEKNKLSKLSGAAFDKEYMNVMIQGHQSAIADFQRAASNAKEPSIKDFASETLPSLKEHLKLAQETLAKPAPTRSSL